MNIKEAWAFGRSHLAQASPSPELDARLLLQHVLTVGHTFLISHPDQHLTNEQERQYRHLIGRAFQREPVPYLIGTAPFFGLDFLVTPAVLIPRPETEQLVELAIEWGRARQHIQVVDIGTGSGCIAICLAQHLPDALVIATDVSAEALKIARRNARHNAIDQIHFCQADLLSPLVSPLEMIVANLPYIAEDEWTLVDDGVKWYEPITALCGGFDGLDLIRSLLRQATTRLHAEGAIFLEIGWQQGPAVKQLARQYFPGAKVELLADFAGHDRFVSIYNG